MLQIQLQGFQLKCMGPRRPFASWGDSGQRISTYFPHTGGIADKIAIVRSMTAISASVSRDRV